MWRRRVLPAARRANALRIAAAPAPTLSVGEPLPPDAQLVNPLAAALSLQAYCRCIARSLAPGDPARQDDLTQEGLLGILSNRPRDLHPLGWYCQSAKWRAWRNARKEARARARTVPLPEDERGAVNLPAREEAPPQDDPAAVRLARLLSRPHVAQPPPAVHPRERGAP